jgi:abortive infection bacteriophage resistance protein
MATAAPAPEPALNYDEQIALLLGRNLAIPNEAYARHCLAHCNYYRLIAYRRTLANGTGVFLAGTTFENLWNVYHFDKQLRRLLQEALKQLEISVRAQWTYEMAMEGGAHAFEEPGFHMTTVTMRNGQSMTWHEAALADLDEDLKRSEDRRRHNSKGIGAAGRPPIWACSEAMSFGLLSRFYAAIRTFRIRNKIALRYGLPANHLASFLHHAVYVRNLCAHHLSVWDRQFTLRMVIPIGLPVALVPSFNPAMDARAYNTLVMLVHLMKVIEPGNDWGKRVKTLIKAQTAAMIAVMGFPTNWEQLPVWAD